MLLARSINSSILWGGFGVVFIKSILPEIFEISISGQKMLSLSFVNNYFEIACLKLLIKNINRNSVFNISVLFIPRIFLPPAFPT